MSRASAASPFYAMSDSECPWILWHKETALSVLPPKNADIPQALPVFEPSATSQGSLETAETVHPTIQRTQYNAVMNRIQQASRKLGQFSNWSS